MRHTAAVTLAGLLVAALPAGMLMIQGPHAVSLSGPARAPGAAGAAGAGPAPGRAAGSAGGEAGSGSRSGTQPGLPGAARVELPFRSLPVPGHRTYVLHTPPPSVAGSPAPLVIVLHGLANTWQNAERAGDWSRYADAHGFLVAYGVGVEESWNAGACCGDAQHRHLNDVGYLVSVVADVAARHQVDRGRVYVVGFSAGDMMAMRAECDRPDVFAAAAGSAGALVSPCHAPARQVRLLHLHGRYDPAVPYAGGRSALLPVVFPAADALARQVAAGSPQPTVVTIPLPCAHLWPRRYNPCGVDGTDLVWRWISRFARAPGAVRAQHPPQF